MSRLWYLWVTTTLAATLAASQSNATSHTATGGRLTAIEFTTEGSCNQIHLRLRDVASFDGTKNFGAGETIVIPVSLLTGTDASTFSPETLRPTTGNVAGVRSVEIAMASEDAQIITIRLAKTAGYRIIMDAETRHIRVDITKPDETSDCNPTQTARNEAGSKDSNSIMQARIGVAAGKYEVAIGLLSKSLTSSDIVEKQAARELTGVALERAGHLVEAKNQYEQFLTDEPQGEARTRVAQRLADLVLAISSSNLAIDDKGDLPSEVDNVDLKRANSLLTDNSGALRGTIVSDTSLRTLRNIKDAAVDPDKWTWSNYGSLGQTFYRDDVFSSGNRNNPNQSEVISNGSVHFKGENQQTTITMRADALNRVDIGMDDGDDILTSIGTFYADVLDKPSGLSARLGRQMRADAGIFGRFDGLSLGWKANDMIDVGLAAGSPVYAREQLPFEDGRYFYGASAVFRLPDTDWSAEIYAIEQRANGILDRRAIGTELRYQAESVAAFAGVDFDTNQKRVASAFLSGNWQFNDRTTFSASLDYRTQPFLLTSNALAGQLSEKLPSLVNLLGEKQVVLLADDRTADATTAAFGMTYRFSDQWQAAFDTLWSDVSGTPASGGVDATLDIGSDVYVGGYLYGSDVFVEDDTVGIGITYADNASRSKLGADLSFRYPASEDLRISPRLRAGMTTKKDDVIYAISPSIGARYRIDRHWLLESEFGVTFSYGSAEADQSVEVQAVIGYRYEF